MATFFGEVQSVYSRAIEEYDEDLDGNDEDEQIRQEVQEKREVHLSWYSEDSQALGGRFLQCSDFILAVGHNAASFLSAYFVKTENWKAIGHATLWNERTSTRVGQTSEQPTGVFYRHVEDPSVLMCKITDYIAEDQLFQWTEKVFGCLQPRGLNVIVLSDSLAADYMTSDYLRDSMGLFLRCLQTSVSKRKIICPLLEQPNIVSGLPAAVLSHCQVHHIPAVAYQCYSDVIRPDSTTMEAYKPVLTILNKIIKLDVGPNADVLSKFAKTSDVQSNLYI
ncbi:proteasome assembly chaperone 1-like [Lampris incognitus]|uniref:proteasome assembly chaperone 1-like n=1 Tax=Lampris incognitus TaxID=2546036 RepID=UPI0024B562E8|nr:proteasome assembly chaperone 1-like [Lampris incognitus]XP_056157686.1 proteasome assembly chaperone 1-like [Lampris incognitus]